MARISELESRTLAEAKELGLFIPLSDKTKLPVSDLGNSEEENGGNVSYRGNLNDYPEEISEGELASVNGNLIIGNGKTGGIFKYLKGTTFRPIQNNSTENKECIVKTIGVFDSESTLHTFPIVLTTEVPTIQNYENWDSNLKNNHTVIGGCIIGENTPGVVIFNATSGDDNFQLFSDGFSDVLGFDYNSPLIYLEIYNKSNQMAVFHPYLDSDDSTESAKAEQDLTSLGIDNLGYFYGTSNVADDITTEIITPYDEFKIGSNNIKISDNKNEAGNVIIHKNTSTLELVTSKSNKAKIYKNAYGTDHNITDNTILTKEFIENVNNWSSVAQEGVEFTITYYDDYINLPGINDVISRFENGGINFENTFTKPAILLSASYQGQSMNLIFCAYKLDDNNAVFKICNTIDTIDNDSCLYFNSTNNTFDFAYGDINHDHIIIKSAYSESVEIEYSKIIVPKITALRYKQTGQDTYSFDIYENIKIDNIKIKELHPYILDPVRSQILYNEYGESESAVDIRTFAEFGDLKNTSIIDTINNTINTKYYAEIENINGIKTKFLLFKIGDLHISDELSSISNDNIVKKFSDWLDAVYNAGNDITPNILAGKYGLFPLLGLGFMKTNPSPTAVENIYNVVHNINSDNQEDYVHIEASNNFNSNLLLIQL